MSNKRRLPRPKTKRQAAPLFAAPTVGDINAVWAQLVMGTPPADLPKLAPLARFVNEKLKGLQTMEDDGEIDRVRREEQTNLNAEYDALMSEIDELYKELPLSVGDPGAYYDISRNIAAKEGRLDRIHDRLAQLHRLLGDV